MVIKLKTKFLDRKKDLCFVLHPPENLVWEVSGNDRVCNAENILPEDLWDQEVLGNLWHPHHLFVQTSPADLWDQAHHHLPREDQYKWSQTGKIIILP